MVGDVTVARVVGGETVVGAERLWWQQLRLSGAAAGFHRECCEFGVLC
jgi:hypothetical protein